MEVFCILIQVGCFNTIEGPIMNVMRKSFQGNYKNVYEKCMRNLSILRMELQKSLKLTNDELIEQFLSMIHRYPQISYQKLCLTATLAIQHYPSIYNQLDKEYNLIKQKMIQLMDSLNIKKSA